VNSGVPLPDRCQDLPAVRRRYTGGTADHLTIANDDLDENALGAFLAKAFAAAAAVLKPGAGFYLWYAALPAPAWLGWTPGCGCGSAWCG